MPIPASASLTTCFFKASMATLPVDGSNGVTSGQWTPELGNVRRGAVLVGAAVIVNDR